ncbi:hypothetical protein GYA54_00865 [Candidatus Kuenenbacteria bacterium]|nr:hypothetical protein [Candidatus Kuenenbacteria bacterium]
MIVKNLGARVFSLMVQNGNDLFNLAPEVGALIRRQKAELIVVDLTKLVAIDPSEARGLADAQELARGRGKSFEIKIPEPMTEIMFSALKGAKLFY